MILTIPCIPQIPVQTIVETESGLEYRQKVNDKQDLNLTSIIPNPTNNSMIISTNIKSKFITSVSILSLDGRELMKSSFRGIHSTENINVSQLNPGIYMVKIETNSGLNPELIKLIKE
ncbi:MAG: T9SS type A sorting domain-containing protein [Saprospiraceae bacterium]|nr:T9SS type A sorting domain-containing protein [Saprospiraceae bacterium]